MFKQQVFHQYSRACFYLLKATQNQGFYLGKATVERSLYFGLSVFPQVVSYPVFALLSFNMPPQPHYPGFCMEPCWACGENAYATPRQTQKNIATPKSNRPICCLVVHHKPPHPHKEKEGKPKSL
jgi:hypothetical protein